MQLAIPPLLTQLIASGVWPVDSFSASRQNLRPLASRDRVRLIAPEEDIIYLSPPPFRTLAQEVAAATPVIVKRFWDAFGALDRVEPRRALIIGDFGLGSDAPIVLDYRKSADAPCVLRLRWAECGGSNDWELCAATFDEFAAVLGLCSA